ncbi:MAG: SAM-dependent methyltransferase [Planctomycetota bacterium]|nr:SAM-dependent methyltransferase [Planctomycetota bacterium]MDA1248014.1 SAM-dependent methyltransferase [Planctomycetota bacterium]
MSNSAAEFGQLLRESLRDGTFIHLVLSRPVQDPERSAGESDLSPTKISVRAVELKAGPQLQFAEQTGSQERHRNLDYESGCVEVESLFAVTFRHGHLFTTTADLMAKAKSGGKVRLSRSKPSRTKPDEATHNRTKQYLIPDGEPCAFLTEIGVMTAEGKVRNSKYDKFRQINRFLEFVDDILPELPADGPLRIVDFGCGKSYLTFALHWLLTERHDREVDIRGLDLKADVIRDCTRIASQLGCRGLSFEIGSIESCEPTSDVDMTVSLHACDTATDAALGKAVEWNSKVILAVPCCQHELSQRLVPELLPPIQRHGILRERFASLTTDSLRALALEILGYKTQIVEFIDMDHTAKNLLIRAVRRTAPGDTPAAVSEYQTLRASFGPVPIALEESLGEHFKAAVTPPP